jgi:hypothetical protein
MTKSLSPEMAEFFRGSGRKGGKIGGKRSLQTMTEEQRRERAKKATAASVQARRNGPQRFLVMEDTAEPEWTPVSKTQALIMADEILNRLTGYARKGSRARKDFYRRDLNWIAEVLQRIEAGEHDPLRPTAQLPIAGEA